jgi:hypothetical protein
MLFRSLIVVERSHVKTILQDYFPLFGRADAPKDDFRIGRGQSVIFCASNQKQRSLNSRKFGARMLQQQEELMRRLQRRTVVLPLNYIGFFYVRTGRSNVSYKSRR